MLNKIHEWLKLAATPKVSTLRANKLLKQHSLNHLNKKLETNPKIAFDTTDRNDRQKRIDKAIQWAEKSSDRFIITQEDRSYPSLLKQIPDAPIVLFAEGNIELLSQPNLAIVGSRDCSPQGRQIAYDFAMSLTRENIGVTSGLALGIDTYAHKGALKEQGSTIAVLGTGLGQIYPKTNYELARIIAEQGCLISEFFPDTPAFSYNFPKRNRLISGLSLGTLVIEASLKSGSLITARNALEQNREVFAVPGSIHSPYSEGCHQLIQQGAKLTHHIKDITDELQIELKNQPKQLEIKLEPEYLRILSYICYSVTSIDEVIDQSGLHVEQILEPMLHLEVAGWIRSVPGGYTRIRR